MVMLPKTIGGTYKKNLGSLKKPPRHKPSLEQIQLLRNTIKATILIFLRMRF